jgi:thioredoxin reductase (NADPH)
MAEITLYGAPWCPDCRRSKKFLDGHRVPYDYVNIDEDAAALSYVEREQNGGRTIPMIVFADGSRLLEPGDHELAAKLGLRSEASPRRSTLPARGSRRSSSTPVASAGRPA